MRRIRGNDIAMVFQEPMTSLNPAFTAGDQIAEAIALHQGKRRKEAWKLAGECWNWWAFQIRKSGFTNTLIKCRAACASA